MTERTTYHPLTVISHWLSAALALLCVASIMLAGWLGRGDAWYGVAMSAHNWSGQLLFLANLLRLMLHSAVSRPEPLAQDPAQALVGRIVHVLLYGIVSFLACSAALLLLAGAAGNVVLGVEIPLLLSAAARMQLASLHGMAGIALVFLVLVHALHVALMGMLSGQAWLARMRLPRARRIDYASGDLADSSYARLDSPVLPGKTLGGER